MFKLITRSLALVAVFAFTNATVSATQGSLNLNCSGVDEVIVVISFSNGINQNLGQTRGIVNFNIPNGTTVSAFTLTAREYDGYSEQWVNARTGAVKTTVAPINNPSWKIASCLTMKVIPA